MSETLEMAKHNLELNKQLKGLIEIQIKFFENEIKKLELGQ